MMRFRIPTHLFGAVFIAAGCEIEIERTPPLQPRPIQVPPSQAAQMARSEMDGDERPKAEPQSPAEEFSSNPQPVSRQAEEDSNSPDLPMLSAIAPDEKRAADRIAAEIRDSLKVGRTLVVWLTEQSSESIKMAQNLAPRIGAIWRDPAALDSAQLEMAVVAYGSEVRLPAPALITNAEDLQSSLDNLKASSADRVVPFAALRQALEKYSGYGQQGAELIFIVVSGSSGSDLPLADEVVAGLKRDAIGVYGVGPTVPFGVYKTQAGANRRGRRPRPATTSFPQRQLFESRHAEQISLIPSAGEPTDDLDDSGYGPFGLERVCRQSGGQFFRIRRNGSPGWDADRVTGEVSPQLLANYAPDYVSEAQYQKLLRENRCRQALHNAAKMPPVFGLESPTTEFRKEANEARFARTISNAQNAAAEREQPLQQLYDTLAAAEADRERLTGARWQAAYDLAMGQVLANKARLDGYNALLATLKQGKAFSQPGSTRWVLEPADEVAAVSTLDKMAKSSRVYLQRVIDEHPGTPWATVAERELRHPAGWKIVEW